MSTSLRFLVRSVAALLLASGCASPSEGDDLASGAAAATSTDDTGGVPAPRPSPEEACGFGDPNDPTIRPEDQALAMEVHARLVATAGANLGDAKFERPRFELTTQLVGNGFTSKMIKFKLDSQMKLLTVDGGGALTLHKLEDGAIWMKYQTFDGPRGELVSCFPLDQNFFAFKKSIGFGQGLSIKPQASLWVDVETRLRSRGP